MGQINIGNILGNVGKVLGDTVAPGSGDALASSLKGVYGGMTIGKSANPSVPSVSPPVVNPAPAVSTFATSSNGKPVMTNNSANGALGTTYSNPTTGKTALPGVSVVDKSLLSASANSSASSLSSIGNIVGTASATKVAGGSLLAWGVGAVAVGMLWKWWKSSNHNPHL